MRIHLYTCIHIKYAYTMYAHSTVYLYTHKICMRKGHDASNSVSGYTAIATFLKGTPRNNITITVTFLFWHPVFFR